MCFPPDLANQTGRPARQWFKGMSDRAMATAEWARDQRELPGLTTVGKFMVQDEDDSGTYAYCLAFSPNGSQLGVGTEVGQIDILDRGKKWQSSKIWQAHQNAIYDIKWMNGGEKIVSVAGDNNLCVWDVGLHKCLATARPPKVTEHQGCMKCLAVSPGGVLASGGRDDAIIIWDVRSPDPTVVNVVKYSHKLASHQGLLAKCCGRKAGQTTEGGRLLATKASVTALEFIDENKVVSCSDLDGVVKVWDIRMSYDRYTGLPKSFHSIPYAGTSSLKGYSSLVLNSAKTKVYVSCQDHTIYTFDVAQCDSTRPEKTFTGHTNGARFYTKLALSADDRYLVSGSAENHACVYNTGPHAPSRPVGKLMGHDNDVTSVAFTTDPRNPYVLATTADDYQIRVWAQSTAPKFTDQGEVIKAPLDAGDYEKTSSLEDYLALCEERRRRQEVVVKSSSDQENSKVPEQPPAAKRPRKSINPLSESNNHQKLRLDPLPCVSPVKINITPSKKPFTSRLNVTPKKRKLNFSPMKAPPWSSPTIDLPNLVMDGKSPHNRPPGTSVKTPRRALDWLSAMSKKRKSEDISGGAEASSTPSKQGKSSRSSSKATTPASTAKAATPKSNRKRKRL